MRVIKENCLNKNAVLYTIEKKKFKVSSSSFSFCLDKEKIDIPIPALRGAHQLDNCALSTACLKVISKNFEKFDFKKSIEGIKSVNWPARSQFISKGKLANKIDRNYVIILDGAHNVSGAKALSKVLTSIDTKWQLIFGYLKTRKPADFLNELKSITQKVITTEITGQENSFSSQELVDIIQKKGISVDKSKNLYEAIEIASQNKLNVCICGSLYLAGEFLKNNQTIPS